jgi:hypothetical protein
MRSAPATTTIKMEDIPKYTHANPNMHTHAYTTTHAQPHTQWPDFQYRETESPAIPKAKTPGKSSSSSSDAEAPAIPKESSSSSSST